MRHPSGYCVYYEASDLLAAGTQEKHDMLGFVLDGMLQHELRAGVTALCLTEDIGAIDEANAPDDVSYKTDTSHGELATATTIRLLKDTARLQGFTNAIKRWPEQEAVLDVGSGPFPVLALAAAMYHQKAQVTAVEIGSEAAKSAERIVDAFALNDRITVVNADIAEHTIDPNTTAAVTETFNAGLQMEPGPQIVRLLHKAGIPIITPSKAQLRLTMSHAEFFQDVDLRHDTHADIAFKGWAPKTDRLREATISTEYYDDAGLVLAYDADTISEHLGRGAAYSFWQVMSQAGDSGRITYELGAHPFTPTISDL